MTSQVLLDAPAAARRRFVNNVADVVGRSNVRGFYLPNVAEGLVVPDEIVAGRNWTHGTTPSGRISRLGKGWQTSFNGTTDYMTTPDAADLSFGNGAADSAFSIVALCNVTDTANTRTLLSKFDSGTSQQEYILRISTTDTLVLLTSDQSAAATPTRTSDAVITQGTWALFGATYSGVGGGTNMNGATLYQNGVAIASTAGNNGAYVAMEDLTAPAEIGSVNGHTLSFYQGGLGLVLAYQKNSPVADHVALTQLMRSYAGGF